MKDDDKQKTDLRQQAEELQRSRHKDPLKLPPDQLPTLFYELEVHQIELEMQNNELKRSQTELELVKEQYADLFDFAPVGYFCLHPNGRIIRANLAGGELLGLHRTQLHGYELFQFVDREQRDTLFRHLRLVFKHQTRQSCELGMLHSDGSSFYAKLDSILLPLNERSSPQCLTLINDISKLKQVEAKNREARLSAEKANQAKSDFLAAASHDLRQPLQAMTTINDILIRELDDEDALKLVNDLSKCLDNMNEMFNALLNINQLESGSITPKISEFAVNELLSRMDITYRPLAEQKGLRLRVVQSSASIRSDPVLLGQVLDNLLSNAIRYTETGKILLGCRSYEEVLRIEIWDTGIGIPEEQHELIFNDFYQLGNPARDSSKGLGLGLATAARSAHLLGQRIELKSWANGSQFSLKVPRVAKKHVAEKTPASVVLEENNSPAISLLVVEDNNVVLYALTRLLETYGYKVSGVKSGFEALAMLEKGVHRFDFILTDYRLPNSETGLELINTVRQALGSDIPALIITGDLEVSCAREVVESGIRVLEKPANVELLNNNIQELLRREPLMH